jgi:hypothetical protein
MIVRVIQTGWRHAWTQWRMAIVLYGVNLLAALMPALAFRSAISPLGSFPAVQELLAGFHFTTFADTLRIYGKEVLGIVPVLPWLMLAYLLFNTFLAGGIISSFCSMEMEFSGKAFFSAAAEYFLRFLRLLLLWVVVVIIAGGIALVGIGMAWYAVLEAAHSETTAAIAALCAAVVLLVIILYLAAVADYARIYIVANDEHRVRRALLASTKFVVKNFGGVFAILFIPLVFFAIALAIYLIKEDWIGMSTAWTVLIVLVVQQVFTAFRMWLHIFVYASETALFMDEMPEGLQM